jgi:amino acid adenylation domain-containing protein
MAEINTLQGAGLEPDGEEGAFSLPLTREQARLWFLAQANPGDLSYHMAYRVNLLGNLEETAMRLAVAQLIDRHEVLRTKFVEVNGEPRQIVRRSYRPLIDRFDLSALASKLQDCELDATERDFVRYPFDLTAGDLMRFRLVRLGEIHYSLIFVMHHIIGDGWSHAILVKDLCAFYNAAVNNDPTSRPSPLALQYGDYALWQQRYTATPDCARHVAYWVEQLQETEGPLHLPRDYSASRGATGASVLFELPDELREPLATVVKDRRWLVSAILLAVYEAVLTQSAGQERFPIVVAVANRERVETADMVGFFVNTIAIPSESIESLAFEHLVPLVQQRLIESQEHQVAPFELVASALGAGGIWGQHPIAQVLFVLQNAPAPRFSFTGLSTSVERIQTGTSKFELSLLATEVDGSISFELEYDTRLFSGEAIQSLRDRFVDMLKTCLLHTDKRIESRGVGSYSIPSVSYGPKRPDLAGMSVPALIAAQAELTPHANAIQANSAAVSYQTLERAICGYATLLQEHAVGRGDVVAITLPRGSELVVALLGTLAAGAAYMTVDPDLPAKYVQDLFVRARAKIIVIAHRQIAFDVNGFSTLVMPSLSTLCNGHVAEIPAPLTSDLAYVHSTSGSTGLPKLVLVEHAGLANVCRWIAETLQLTGADRCLLKTPQSFDAFARELYPILIAGGTLIVAAPDAHRDMPLLQQTLFNSEATVFHCVPSQLEELLAIGPLPPTLRAIMCGGERLGSETVERLRAVSRARLWNVYGPTEATVDATAFALDSTVNSTTVPIGTPIPNLTASIVGRDNQVLPFGAVGEIHLGGVGVARGYLDRTDDTSFSVEPVTGERQYATGDWGRMTAGGILEFLGRRDRQLKRRGVRIEPADIERLALGHRAVGAAHVCTAKGLGSAPERIVAFVAPRREWEAVSDLDDASAKTADWNEVFATAYEKVDFNIDPFVNTHGWIDSVSRAPIPQEEIVSAADEAAARIRRWRPKRVLEIGCGTGLLLFRLAQDCLVYDAVDCSQQALDYVAYHLRALGLSHVSLVRASIPNYQPIAGAEYDAIVFNSVLQYLHSPENVSTILNNLARCLAPEGFFFLGDVRDFRLRETEAIQREIIRSGPDALCASLVFAAELDCARDDELCLDPAFFRAWAESSQSDLGFCPPIIEAKTSVGSNELVKYRFDVTIARKDNRESKGKTTMAQVAGLYRHRLLWPELTIARRITGTRPGQSVAEFNKCDALVDSPDLLSPKEAVEVIRRGLQPHFLRHAFCLITPEPGRFEVVDVTNAGIPGEAASILGYAGKERSRAESLGRFRRFLDETEDLTTWLRARLPMHMMPDGISRIPAMPLTEHGKTNTAFLELISTQCVDLARSASQAVPSDEIETAICDVFASVVATDIAVDDDFFLRGGHSLLATRARARLSGQLGIEIPLRLLFDYPSARSLAPTLRALLNEDRSIPAKIAPRHTSTTVPSFAQKRLWFVEKLGTSNTVYNIAHAMRVEGSLDLDALDRSVGKVIARHAPLRSRFPDDGGQPTVVVDPPRALGNLELVAEGELLSMEQAVRAIEAVATQKFDLERDRLLRVFLVCVESTSDSVPVYLLALVAHHIVADGWSMTLAMSELALLYNAGADILRSKLDSLSVDYYDIAAWQDATAAAGAFERDLQFWTDELSGAPARIALPYDYPPPPRRSWSGEQIAFDIPSNVWRDIKALAVDTHTTEFMVLLAVFEILMHKMSGMSDLVVGTVIASRYRAEFEPLIGCLVNPIALRSFTYPDDTFNELLLRVRARALAAFEHQAAPFEMLLERLSIDRRTDYQAVFQVLFAMQNAGSAEPDFTGLRCERVGLRSLGSMFDLSLEVRETPRGPRGVLEFSADLFRIETARLIVHRYLYLLEQFSASPDVLIVNVPLAPPTEHSCILSFSRGEQSPCVFDETLPGRLYAQAVQAPDQPAIEDGPFSLTYGQLVEGIAEVGERLRLIGVKRGDLVAVHVSRGVTVAIAIFGTQFIGATPVYIDPALPQHRKCDLLAEMGTDVCLSREADGYIFDSRTLWLEELHPKSFDLSQPKNIPAPETRPNDIAFATFTSGSSGAPKAVLVSHRALCLRIRANDVVLSPLQVYDRVAHAYSFNYDGGLMTLFWPLFSGATLVFLPLELLGDSERLRETLNSQAITVFDGIPAVIRGLFSVRSSNPTNLRMVVTGGDVCPPDLPRLVLESADVLFANQYGPCEAVVNATTWTADRRSNRKANIGKPLPDTNIFIVDQADRRCPIGIPGEILIGGPALAEGYLNADELTSQRFVVLDALDTRRVYRTGDLGRWTCEGEIEFVGRLDRQVQIRGMRSDPAEVEQILRNHSDVADCCVSAAGEGESVRFVAFIVPESLGTSQSNDDPEQERLKDWVELFQELYRPRLQASLANPDYSGWNDTISGEPIPEVEMSRWRAATLERIRSRKFHRVLEIGAGLGLLAIPLARDAARYLAIDTSSVAVQRLTEMALSQGLSSLTVLHLGVDQIEKLEEEFDLIVLNSVIQYFPHESFLRRAIEACGRLLAPGGHIFVGDICDARLTELLHTEVAVARCGLGANSTDIRTLAAERDHLHEELHVAPAFFAGLSDGVGSRFAALPLLKLDSGQSEMVRYRYDVWLSHPTDELSKSGENVMEWSNRGTFTGELEMALKASKASTVRVASIPNQRLAFARDARARMSGDDEEKTRILRRTTARGVDGLDPDELLHVAHFAGRTLLVTPSRCGDATRFDALFLTPGDTEPPDLPGELLHVGRLFTDPLIGRRAGRLRASIAAYAANRLPSHMRPSSYVFVDRFPLRTGGKVDIAALAAMNPGNKAEIHSNALLDDLQTSVMADIWRTILECDSLARDADFFSLGGHSLLAARLVSAIRREFNVNFPVLRLFELRTLDRVSREVKSLRLSRTESDRTWGNDITWTPSGGMTKRELTIAQRVMLAKLASLPAGRDQHVGITVEAGGHLDSRVLEEAVAAIVTLHPMLGRRFRADGQLTSSNVRSQVEVVDGAGELAIASARRPMNLEEDGPLAISVVKQDARSVALAIRAHPSFFDAESLRIALDDLAAAYRMLCDGRIPFDDRTPTDYSELAAWERTQLGTKPILASSKVSTRSRQIDYAGRPPERVSSVQIVTKWTRDETTALDRVAGRFGVTPCALLLGGFVRQLQRLTKDDEVCVECPVSTRSVLNAAGVIGPFAIDVPISFRRIDLKTSQNAAMIASTQIASLFDKIIFSSHTANVKTNGLLFGFTYQEPVRIPNVHWGKGLAPTLRASPFWVDLKLSVRREPSGIECQLTYDPAVVSSSVADAVLAGVIHEVAEEDQK